MVPDGEVEVVLKPDVLPEKPGWKCFMKLLAQIAKEPEFSEGDRSTGNFELPDEEWEEWKARPGQHKDEYEEEDSEESDTQSIVTATTTASRASKPPSGPHVSVSVLPKPGNNKMKAAGRSKRKHEDLDCGSDGDSEPEAESECPTVWKLGILTPIFIWTDFTYQIDVSSKTKDVQKVFAVSSKTNWVDFEQKIAGILNIFTANLCAQYVLSIEPTGAIPIALASQADLAELHKCLVPLVVPPQDANGSVSKRKMKEVIVRVTDKGDDVALPAAGNGKVGDRHFSKMTTKKSFQKKSES